MEQRERGGGDALFNKFLAFLQTVCATLLFHSTSTSLHTRTHENSNGICNSQLTFVFVVSQNMEIYLVGFLCAQRIVFLLQKI